MAKPDPVTPTRRALFVAYCEERGWKNEDGTWMITSISNAIGKARSKVSDLLNGQGSFGQSIAREIETALELPQFYLDGIAEDSEFDDVNRVNVRISAGDGHIEGYEEVIGSLKFSRQFLRSCSIPNGKARVIDVHGHSMHPTIRDGAVLLVDISKSEPVDGQIFALARPAEGAIVKRLVQTEKGWIAKSDNPDHESFPINHGEPITIIGRAIWMGTKL